MTVKCISLKFIIRNPFFVFTIIFVCSARILKKKKTVIEDTRKTAAISTKEKYIIMFGNLCYAYDSLSAWHEIDADNCKCGKTNVYSYSLIY